jgi:hypothetical protein
MIHLGLRRRTNTPGSASWRRRSVSGVMRHSQESVESQTGRQPDLQPKSVILAAHPHGATPRRPAACLVRRSAIWRAEMFVTANLVDHRAAAAVAADASTRGCPILYGSPQHGHRPAEGRTPGVTTAIVTGMASPQRPSRTRPNYTVQPGARHLLTVRRAAGFRARPA